MKGKLAILMLAVLVLSFSLAVAAPSGASTTAGTSETGTATSSSSLNADGGNVTYVDVSSNVITSRWAGFYGNVSGNLLLADASANNFYQWTVGSMDGAVVYAASGSVSDWSSTNIVPLTNANAPAWVQGAATDNFTNTFSATESFSSSSLTIASTPYVTTYNSTGVAGNLKTYALYATAETAHVWAGKVVDDANGFNGNSVDYQILLPAQTGTTYNFYLELP